MALLLWLPQELFQTTEQVIISFELLVLLYKMKGTWHENVLKERAYIHVQTSALVHVNGILLIMPSIIFIKSLFL